jgi:DNA-binding transcriptional LysR family regulator
MNISFSVGSGIMWIDKVNLNYLRIFEVVFRLRSMTGAAKELHLTQSGVSQHITTLEKILGISLFDREQRQLIPTPQAASLYEKCKQGLYEIESGLAQSVGQDVISGTVRIGMPPEYGTTVIVPIVSRFLREYPQVNAKLQFGLVQEISAQLLSGMIDFAFVDSFAMDKRITVEKFFDEEYGLYASKDYLKSLKGVSHSKAFYEKLSYVEYLEGDAILRSWFSHHLKSTDVKLNVRAYTDSPKAIQSLIVQKVGAGVLPRHMAEEPQIKKQIAEIPGSRKPLVWVIYLAHIEDRTQSPAIKSLLTEIHKSLGK